MLAPMRSPHQRRARSPWTSTLGPKPSSDVCGLVVVLVIRVQPRLKKKQSCAGECADCSTRAGVTDLAAAGFCVFADAAAAAAKAMAAAADLAIGRDCRTMVCAPRLSFSRPPARAPHGRSIATDRRLAASAPRHWKGAAATTIPAACARPQREGVAACASNGWRCVAWRLSVRWCCRRRGEHGALRARDNRCSFCAMTGEALRREVDHEAMRSGERSACDAQHRDTTRSSCGGVCERQNTRSG
jgi:hypothetical protein